MKNNIYPKNYESLLDLVETQKAIKLVKDTFERELARELDLIRVSAPLFVEPGTGLNDNLSGYEKAVNFVVNENDRELEIVQSLAKWKRYALKKYNIDGLYTDMNAIRRFEDTDNLHSLYVDQWDWERRIEEKDRNVRTLMKIYDELKKTFKGEVIITLEDHGCFTYLDGYKLIPSIEVDNQDSTGAGDIYHGAFTYCIAKEYDIITSMKISNIAGALSVTRIGGRYSIFELDEVMAKYKELNDK